MSDRRWMIYGANGYTGRLVVAEARRRGLSPVLAGRRAEAIRPLAEAAGLPWRCFDVDRAERALADVDVLLVTAGPFSSTAASLLDACARTGTAYLDVDGDVGSLAETFARRDELADRGALAVPAVGFDVAPSDCLTALVLRELPGAERLDIAWGGAFEPSRGTARSMAEAFPRGGLARRGGQLVRVPIAAETRPLDFPTGDRTVVTVPWGDLVTSAHTAPGVPEVWTWAAMSRAEIRGMRVAAHLLPVLRRRPVARLVDAVLRRSVTGPDADVLASGRSWFHVQARRGDEVVTGTLGGPEGYVLTARSAVEAVRRVLAGEVARRGVLTPSEAFGPRFVAEVEGCAVVVRPGRAPAWPEPPETPSAVLGPPAAAGPVQG